jgi:hypothetical protein
VVKRSFVLRIKFSGGKQFSSPKSPTSCSCKTLAGIINRHLKQKNMDNTTYEFFIRRAWQCDRFEKGANTDTWEILLYKKYNFDNTIGTATETENKAEYAKKFAEVKQYIDNAYNNLLYRATKINNNDDLVDTLLDLKTRATNSDNPADLYQTLKDSFETLNNHFL